MDYENKCSGGKVKASTLAECPNIPVNPSGINGPVVGKIPVVIAEPIVQVVLEAHIELEEPVFEIKRIKKNLFINQCKLIDLGGCTGKLFLGGFVRKNIEYATAKCVSEENKSISGDIRHTTVNVPFTCVTQIHYVTPPNIRFCEGPREASLFIDSVRDNACCDSIIGRSPCEQNFQHTECFNEKVFCELEDVKFFEDDIHENPKPVSCGFPTEWTFDCITEKMVVLIRLKLLQNQQVNIPDKFYGKDEKHK